MATITAAAIETRDSLETFRQQFNTLRGDIQGLTFGASIVFEGSTADDFETTFNVTDPTADRTITFGDETGTVLTTGATNVLTGNMMKSSSTLLIVNSAGSTLKTIIGAGSAS